MTRQLFRANPRLGFTTIKLLSAALVALTLAASAAPAQTAGGTAGQTGAPPSPRQTRDAPPSPDARTTADEDFELNISERRITERDFEASTTVEVGDERARGLNLRVGVALGASNIDVLLRNVRGRVRFRASLAPLLERLSLRPPPAPAPARPSP